MFSLTIFISAISLNLRLNADSLPVVVSVDKYLSPTYGNLSIITNFLTYEGESFFIFNVYLISSPTLASILLLSVSALEAFW